MIIVHVCKDMSEMKHGLIYEVYAIPNLTCGVMRSAKEMYDDDKYWVESKGQTKKKEYKEKKRKSGRADIRTMVSILVPCWGTSLAQAGEKRDSDYEVLNSSEEYQAGRSCLPHRHV